MAGQRLEPVVGLKGAAGCYEKFVKLSAILSSVDYHLCIGKNSPYVNLIHDFDKIIAAVKASGVM
jgi:hypothetical protein